MNEKFAYVAGLIDGEGSVMYKQYLEKKKIEKVKDLLWDLPYSIIDRSNKKSLLIKKKIISHIKIDVPTFNKKNLPKYLKKKPISKPGSRFIR